MHFARENFAFSLNARLCIITDNPENESENAIIPRRKASGKIYESAINSHALPISKTEIRAHFAGKNIGSFSMNPHTPEKKEIKKTTFTDDSAALFTELVKINFCFVFSPAFRE